MPPRTRARRYDPEKTRKALFDQAWAVRGAVWDLTAEQYALPTRLGDWTVRELVVHVARQIESLTSVLNEDPPAGPADLTLDRWAVSTAGIAGLLDEDAREAVAEDRIKDTAPEIRLDSAVHALEGVLLDTALPDRLVRIHLGTMTAADFAVTRLVELVVHADDLTAATGVDIPLDRQALAAVTRLLADALAAKAPGGAVELRVPPFAVVQCVPGPRHTRGTPPNVVETDPRTWLHLSTGRLTWAEAIDSAKVSASGERSDLSPHLPVLG